MIIEFIGAPGAGKTTLMATVMEYFQEQGVKSYKIVEAARPFAQRTALGSVIAKFAPAFLSQPLLWRLFYQLSLRQRRQFQQAHPELMDFVHRTQVERPLAADVEDRQVLYWFEHLTGYYEFLRHYLRSDEALVLDEGFVHRVVQLFSSSVEEPDAAKIRHYLGLVPRPDLIVFAQTPRDICEQRIYSRGLWDRAKHKDVAEISQFVANAHAAVNGVADFMLKEDWPMITVDNGRTDLEAVRADLRQQLAQASPKHHPLEAVQ